MTGTEATGKVDPYAWLKELKPGDEVILTGGPGDDSSIRKVERVTATMIVLESVLRSVKRVSKRDGYVLGHTDSWYRQRITEATPEVMAAIRHKAKVRRIALYKEADFMLLADDQLQAFIDVMDAAIEKFKGDQNNGEDQEDTEA